MRRLLLIVLVAVVLLMALGLSLADARILGLEKGELVLNKRFQIFAYFTVSYILQKLLLILFKRIKLPHSIIIKKYHLHHVFWGILLLISSAYLIILFFEKTGIISNLLLFSFCWGLAWVIDEIWMVICLTNVYSTRLNIITSAIFALVLFVLSLI
jgi:hypothetical protein